MRFVLSRRRARGFALIEMLGALAIAALLLAGIAAMMDSSLDDVRAQQAAQYQAQVTAAATRALKRDYDAWLQRANAQTPVVMTLADLQATNDLPAALQTRNAYGQHTCVLVKRTANGVGLDALVVTTGGEAIGDKELGLVAASAGPGGGSIATSAPALARGAFDAWRMPLGAYLGGSSPTCDPADAAPPNAGHLANEIFFNGPGQQINSDYLYRVGVGGHPEANAMQVPIWLTHTFVEGAARRGELRRGRQLCERQARRGRGRTVAELQERRVARRRRSLEGPGRDGRRSAHRRIERNRRRAPHARHVPRVRVDGQRVAGARPWTRTAT
ncbi:hypothetical protein Y049_6116 [Burkholderia pseudomallei MSHR684]|nr:hypothetical protein Y049_6116 [Burkholderia pseudomallei MSHR684]